jgi:hypothetical protein
MQYQCSSSIKLFPNEIISFWKATVILEEPVNIITHGEFCHLVCNTMPPNEKKPKFWRNMSLLFSMLKNKPSKKQLTSNILHDISEKIELIRIGTVRTLCPT